MSYDGFRLERDGDVARITLDVPGKLNRVSMLARGQLLEVFEELDADQEVRFVVLTGAGGAFCAGGDVKGMADGTGGGSTAAAGSDLDSRIHAQRLSQRSTAGKLYRMPKPTIAAIPGAAAAKTLRALLISYRSSPRIGASTCPRASRARSTPNASRSSCGR